ncbi:unnamed protein product [Urochloa humidicola]
MASTRSASSSRSSASSARGGAGMMGFLGFLLLIGRVQCSMSRLCIAIATGRHRDGFPGAFSNLGGGWGMQFLVMYDGTTPFVKQLLIDLRDTVWALAKENAKLRDSISDAKQQRHNSTCSLFRDLEQMLVQREGSDWRRALAEEEEQIKKFEKERIFLLSTLFVVSEGDGMADAGFGGGSAKGKGSCS